MAFFFFTPLPFQPTDLVNGLQKILLNYQTTIQKVSEGVVAPAKSLQMIFLDDQSGGAIGQFFLFLVFYFWPFALRREAVIV